ncbi:glutathione S-transferase family protein [Terricaulis sp.]|uniref:glutathione S-transferase family protein n=1 Tax=Terricaulis sp. TaxID=2768686 RepID=UPI002AC70C00|nr:glutathione S-transferase family protein [Terricaulis sp.]MDZ4689961.1 glutathione S-transferase family protein [Terricaulis sp.]
MTDLILTTYDWVPEAPRGFVRDLRIRWALEEEALPYRVETTPFKDRGPEHFAHQPFAQVPWLTDGDLTIFESGAILLHLGEMSDKLLPTDRRARSECKEWLVAALNSMEMASVPWSIFHFMRQTEGQMFGFFDNWVKDLRVKRLETVLAQREWLAGSFSIADILMVDVLRLIDRFSGLDEAPACKAYVERGMARPAFKKAYADQMAHFAAAD